MVQMNTPMVSVVMPIYNSETFLADTIGSVAAQTHENLEILLINHASTDGSRDVCEQFARRDPRFKILDLQVNTGGPAHPRNIGMKAAHGDYIAFIDSDDLWLPSKIERQLEFMESMGCRFCSTDRQLIDEDGRILRESLRSRLHLRFMGKSDVKDLLKNNFIVTSSVLVDKRLLRPFKEGAAYVTVEDFDQWIWILADKDCRYRYLDEDLVKYRVLEGSATDRSNLVRQELKAHKVIVDFLIEHTEHVDAWYYRFIAGLIRKRIRFGLTAKKTQDSE